MLVTVEADKIPNKGMRTTGRRAVAAIGTESEIQYTAIINTT